MAETKSENKWVNLRVPPWGNPSPLGRLCEKKTQWNRKVIRGKAVSSLREAE